MRRSHLGKVHAALCPPRSMHSHKCRPECQTLPPPPSPGVSSASPQATYGLKQRRETNSLLEHGPNNGISINLQHILAPVANDAKVLRGCDRKAALLEGRELDSIPIKGCPKGTPGLLLRRKHISSAEVKRANWLLLLLLGLTANCIC